MNNLLSLIWNYRIAILFLIFETISFTFLVNSNAYQKAQFLSGAYSVSGSMYASVNNVSQYISLKDQADELAKENASLKAQMKESFIRLKSPVVYIEDTLYEQQYQYISSKVINGSVNKINNYLVIDQGDEQGIKPLMGVINGHGIVGIVRDVSAHYATVIPLIHSKSRISAKIKKNDYFGFIEHWDGDDPKFGIMNDIPNHVELEKGDTIVTKGSSTIFPENIVVGTVESYNEIKGSVFSEIRIRFSVDFNNISYVKVIRNLLKEEQLELQKQMEDVE